MPGTKRREAVGIENTRAKSTSGLAAIGMSPLLWGGAMTVGFYQLIPYLPFNQATMQRYFCATGRSTASRACSF